MGDMGDVFKGMEKSKRERHERNLNNADLSGLTKHTVYHYSCELLGKRLDYWPTKNKWRWDNRIYHGEVQKFINKKRGLKNEKQKTKNT